MEEGKMTFEQIYHKYHKKIYLYLCSLSHDSDMSEELTQCTFYKAFLNITKFRGDCDILTWLTSIAKNEYYSYIRKVQRTVPLDETIGTDTYAHTEVHLQNLEDDVEQAINSLENEAMKEVMYYRLFMQIPYKDIAEILKISEPSAKVLYHRGKEKLRKILREDMGYEM